jgi:hypothetical protein
MIAKDSILPGVANPSRSWRAPGRAAGGERRPRRRTAVARTGYDDVVDVHVMLCAIQRRHVVVTSDPDDMSRIDPALPVIRV